MVLAPVPWVWCPTKTPPSERQGLLIRCMPISDEVERATCRREEASLKLPSCCFMFVKKPR